MICKDCEPKAGEVVLCLRHADMERHLNVVEALLVKATDEQKERRRYALLQAAATIFTLYDLAASVDTAKHLLAEIEKREPEKHS